MSDARAGRGDNMETAIGITPLFVAATSALRTNAQLRDLWQ